MIRTNRPHVTRYSPAKGWFQKDDRSHALHLLSCQCLRSVRFCPWIWIRSNAGWTSRKIVQKFLWFEISLSVTSMVNSGLNFNILCVAHIQRLTHFIEWLYLSDAFLYKLVSVISNKALWYGYLKYPHFSDASALSPHSNDGGHDPWPSTLFNLNTAKGLFRAIFYSNCVAFHVSTIVRCQLW